MVHQERPPEGDPALAPYGETHHHHGQRPSHRWRLGLGSGLHIRTGCEYARFVNAFLQMGLVFNTSATWQFNRAMGINKALDILNTGDWLEAEEALPSPAGTTGRS